MICVYHSSLVLTHCVYRAVIKEYCRWVFRRVRGLAWGYPPFLGRSTRERPGIVRESRGRRAGRVPESGRTDQGDSRWGGVLAWKVSYAWKVLPARKARVCGKTFRRGKGVMRGRDCWHCGNSLSGRGVWTMITVINNTAWVYLAGTTFSGGLPPCVPNHLVGLIVV